MIVISEKKLDKEEIANYKAKGYRFAYGYEDFQIKPRESVGIILETMYRPTINLIESLLYRKHRVTIKYEDQSYILDNLEQWKHTYQSEKDMLHLVTDKHPIYELYLQKCAEYREKRRINVIKQQFDALLDVYEQQELPQDDELIQFITTFAPLYQVDVDYTDRLSQYRAYFQIKWYLDNNMEYVNEVKSIQPEDEPMFANIKFKIPPYEEPIEETSFGNLNYLEDFIYKNRENTCTD